MQTLSPISPTIAKPSSRVTNPETELAPAIAQSPLLQTALSGLEASLNDELDRYRHWQENGQTISYLNPFRPRSVATDSVWTSASLAELAPIAPAIDINSDPHRQNSATLKMPMMPPLSTIETLSSQARELNGLSYESLANLDLTNLDRYTDQQSLQNQNLESFAEPTSSANPAMAKPVSKSSTLDDDDILQNFANDYAEHYGQHDQNQSEFGQQIPIPSAPAPKSALHSLLNPVGLISLLLLLCSSAAIGYLLVDPSSVMKLFKPETNSKSSQSLVDPNAANNEANKVDASLLSPVPFMGGDRSLNSLNSLSDLKLDQQPLKTDLKTDLKNGKNNKPNSLNSNPIGKPSGLFVPSSMTSSLRTVPSTNFSRTPIAAAPLPPVLAPIERSPEPSYQAPARETYREPAPQPARVSPPRTSRPAAAVAPAAPTSVKYAAPLSAAPQSAPQPVAPAAPSASYRVVVENGYAASAQQVERDAFVRPSDGQVQVGSYRDPNTAQQRLEQLRRQGIPARIE